MASQSSDQNQGSAQSTASIVHVPAQNISDLSSLPIASTSEPTSIGELVHVPTTHRGLGSVHGERRRPSSSSSLSEPARRTRTDGVQAPNSDLAESSPSDFSFAQSQTIAEVASEQGQVIAQVEPNPGQSIVEVVHGQTVDVERLPPLPDSPRAADVMVSAEQVDAQCTSVVAPSTIEVPTLPLGRPRVFTPLEGEQTPRKRRVVKVEGEQEMVAVPADASIDVEQVLGQLIDEDAMQSGPVPEVRHCSQDGHGEADDIVVDACQFMATSQATLQNESVLAPISNANPAHLLASQAQEQTESGDVPMTDHPEDSPQVILLMK